MTIRCQLYRVEQELTVNSLKGQGATVEQAPYLPYAFYLSDYSHLEGLKSFVMGRFVVQDVSSMLVTEAADPKPIFAQHREERVFIWQIRCRDRVW